MAKKASVKLGWVKSPSADVVKVVVEVVQNGVATSAEVGPEVESFVIEVEPLSSVQFKVTCYDAEGNKATSEVYSFVLGDLEAPLPATGLFHEVLGVVEV